MVVPQISNDALLKPWIGNRFGIDNHHFTGNTDISSNSMLDHWLLSRRLITLAQPSSTMHSIIIPSCYVLMGISAYATIIHLSIGLRKPRSPVHLRFASVTFLAIPFMLAHVTTLQSADPQIFAMALKWALSIVIMISICFFWFISVYVKQRSSRFLVGLTVYLLLMIGINLSQPYSLQYTSIDQLTVLHLPWGETVTRAVGQHNSGFAFMAIGFLLGFVHVLYILQRLPRSLSNQLMSFSILCYLLSSVVSICIRMGILDGLEPGALIFVAMIMIVSILLSQETQQQLLTSEKRFRSLVEQSPFSIQILSPGGHTLQVNAAWEALWGQSASQTADRAEAFAISSIDQDIWPHLKQGLLGGVTAIPPRLYTLTDAIGHTSRQRWIRGYLYPIKDSRGHLREAILVHEDVTEKKRVEDAIHLIAAGVATAGDRFFDRLVQSLADLFGAEYVLLGVLDQDTPNHIQTLAVCAHGTIAPNFGYSLVDTPCAEVLGRDTCIYPRHVQQAFPRDRLLAEMDIESYIGTPLFDGREQPLGILTVLDTQPIEQIEQVREILEIFAARAEAEVQRLQDEARIHRLAYHDYLTHLPNRARFHEYLEQVLKRMHESGEEGALLLIDLDHFKTINDALGHDVGDEVLRAIARRLEQVADETALVARLGGDEFVVLIAPGLPCHAAVEHHALQLAHRISATLSSPIVVGDRTLNVGASIGVALFPTEGMTQLDILRHADMALYRAKSLGRGVTQLYLASLQAAAADRLRLEEGLRQVIANHELELYFQPQVNAEGHILGAEVLLRWQHPELGTISPVVFIPVAEETGLIHSIGQWVLEQSCLRLTTWLDRDIPFKGHLSVNVSPWQFTRPDFVEQVCQTIAHYQLDPSYFVLELTETALLYDLAETIEKLAFLRSHGIRIALDDFGTGYSSLAHLKHLPLDFLKIDKAFVNELESNSKNCLVASIISISHLMDLEVVAEGVESMLQHDVLVQLGCQSFQGYLFGRPLSERDFIEWIVSGQLAQAGALVVGTKCPISCV